MNAHILCSISVFSGNAALPLYISRMICADCILLFAGQVFYIDAAGQNSNEVIAKADRMLYENMLAHAL